MARKLQTQIYEGDDAISFKQVVAAPGSPFSASTVSTLFDIDVSNYAAAAVHLTGTYSGQALAFEQSLDGTNWAGISGYNPTVQVAQIPGQSSNSQPFIEYRFSGAMRFRARLSAIASGTIIATVNLIADRANNPSIYATAVGAGADAAAINGNPVRIGARAISSNPTAVSNGQTADLITSLDRKVINLPYSIPENTWSYAAASGGITNTAAVTVKAAGGAGLRNYVSSLQVQNVSAVASEIVLRDGASGTVIWRGYLPASMTSAVTINFLQPLRGTANTLLEVAVITTGTQTYFNIQGYIGA